MVYWGAHQSPPGFQAPRWDCHVFCLKLWSWFRNLHLGEIKKSQQTTAAGSLVGGKLSLDHPRLREKSYFRVAVCHSAGHHPSELLILAALHTEARVVKEPWMGRQEALD